RDPVEDGIAIRRIEGLEERPRSSVSRERFCEVRRYGRRLCAVVRTFPSPITLRPIDLGDTGRFHASACDQRLDLCAVDLGPRAARGSRRESLQPGPFVQRSFLTIDPAPSERRFESALVRETILPLLLPRDAEEDARGPRVVRAQPGMPLSGGR